LACLLCNKEQFKRHIIVKDVNFLPNVNEFEIYQCTNCGLFQLVPIPDLEELDHLYTSQNVFSKETKNPNQHRKFFNQFEKLYDKYGYDDNFIVKLCLKSCNAKNVLDVGCSTGKLLKTFKDHIPDIELLGIDVDPKAKQNAVAELKDDIIIGNFLEINFDKKFDVIIFNTVIEHIPYIIKYIQKAKQLLTDNGIIFISTPDMSSKVAIESGPKWELISRPDKKIGHVMWFNYTSIKYLAKVVDMSIINLRNRGSMFYYLPRPLRNLITGIFGYGPLGRPIKYYYLRILAAVIFDCILSEKFSYGEELYAILKKN